MLKLTWLNSVTTASCTRDTGASSQCLRHGNPECTPREIPESDEAHWLPVFHWYSWWRWYYLTECTDLMHKNTKNHNSTKLLWPSSCTKLGREKLAISDGSLLQFQSNYLLVQRVVESSTRRWLDESKTSKFIFKMSEFIFTCKNLHIKISYNKNHG